MALNNLKEGDDQRDKCLKVRSSIENIVHGLLRVKTMNSRLPEIFKPLPSEKGKKVESLSEKGIAFVILYCKCT